MKFNFQYSQIIFKVVLLVFVLALWVLLSTPI
jgi:hypothetical protein